MWVRRRRSIFINSVMQHTKNLRHWFRDTRSRLYFKVNMIKERRLNLMLSVCLWSVAICLIKCFILPSVLRFFKFVVPHLVTCFSLKVLKKLIIRMRKQHAETLGIKKIVTEMMCRHWQPFEKFGLSVEKIALDISYAK